MRRKNIGNMAGEAVGDAIDDIERFSLIYLGSTCYRGAIPVCRMYVLIG